MTHICVRKLTTFGLDNGLSPSRRQAIMWTNAGILLIRTLGTNFSEILIEIHTFSFTKMHLKMSSGKWRTFCLGLNVLMVSLCWQWLWNNWQLTNLSVHLYDNIPRGESYGASSCMAQIDLLSCYGEWLYHWDILWSFILHDCKLYWESLHLAIHCNISENFSGAYCRN